MDNSLAHLTAAVESADNKLESIGASVLDLRKQVDALTAQFKSEPASDPGAIEALAAKLDATVADVEAKLAAPTPPVDTAPATPAA